MQLITEPTVVLVGTTSIDQYEIRAALEKLGFTWDDLAQVSGDDAEWLVEMAGRTCYQSWRRQNDPSMGGRTHADHIANLIDSGHLSCLEHCSMTFLLAGLSRSLTHELVRHRIGVAYCLAGDTEVWSGSRVHGRWNGHKKSWTLAQLYGWSQDSRRKGRVKLCMVRCFDGERFVPAHIRAVSQSGIKPIYHVILADGKTIRCTGAHRFLTSGGTAKQFRPLQDLTVGSLLATNGQLIYRDREWLQTKYHSEGFSQEEIAAEAGVSHHTIRTWIRKYGLQKPMGSWTRGSKPWNKGLSYHGKPHSMESRQLQSEQKLGEKNPAWCGDSVGRAGAYIRAHKMISTAGKRCAVCDADRGIHRHHRDRNLLNNDLENIDFLCARCHRARHQSEDGHPNAMTVKWVPIVSIEPAGEEMTYDLEVDHPDSNFVANGIVTHNSQLSQRYVDSSDVNFVVPPDVQGMADDNPSLYAAWVSHCEASVELYKRLEQHIDLECSLALSPRDRHKKARQAARSVLPNATETRMLFTANVRQLRHMIASRASAAADLEIRNLFIQIFEVFKDKYPLLAHGMSTVQLPDGTRGVVS